MKVNNTPLPPALVQHLSPVNLNGTGMSLDYHLLGRQIFYFSIWSVVLSVLYSSMNHLVSMLWEILQLFSVNNTPRSICILTSSKHTAITPLHRMISKNKTHRNTLSHQEELQKGCRMGIDIHADTSCADRHVRIMERIDGLQYNVSPFI